MDKKTVVCIHNGIFSSVQSLSCVCSMPGLPVHHQLLELTQTHVHRVGDPIQPSHPLSSPSPPAPNPSQHQSLFQSVNSSHEVALSMLFSQIVPPSPSPAESKSLFFTPVSLLLSCIYGHCYHLSKFHIYVLIYCIGVFLSDLLHSV